jgi:hypothetical protein
MLAVFAGCGVHKPFQPFDNTAAIKPGSVAVISGDKSEPDLRITEYLTLELKKRSTFRVMSQDEVARRVGRYPQAIKVAEPKDVNRPVWFPSTEKTKIDAIQASTGTDYILVVWVTDLSRWVTTNSQGGSQVSYSASVLGNMIEYPKARPIAYTNFAESKSQSCCLFGKSEGEDISALLKNSAESIADKFIAATNSERASK